MTRAELLFEIFVELLIKEGLIESELAEKGIYVYSLEREDEIDGELLNKLENKMLREYKSRYEQEYGSVTEDDWLDYIILCWKNGL